MKAKLADTSDTVIGVVMLVMGLERLLRALFCPLLNVIRRALSCSEKRNFAAA